MYGTSKKVGLVEACYKGVWGSELVVAGLRFELGRSAVDPETLSTKEVPRS